MASVIAGPNAVAAGYMKPDSHALTQNIKKQTMEKRDNPHAKGLSINEDWVRDEDFTVTNEHGKTSIDVDLTHSRLKLENMERDIQEQITYWKQMRCVTVPKVSIKKDAEVFPSLLKETISFYFGQLPHLCAVIPIIETDRQGLALTNPEE
jgi:hypothetical protein